MSDSQAQRAAMFLVGLALLIVSLGTAWVLSQSSRIRRVESGWLVALGSVVFFVAGVVACYFGVSAIIEG